MKQLIINGDLCLINDSQYFPFTYKISDLEEINIINFPSTKTVELPRNSQNDEIFGHIAEITRINYGYEDNKSGISFNQFKKAEYTLLNNSEVVSEGILRIVNITNDNYEVELYDNAINLLEDLEDKYLNELEIINPQTGLPLSEKINHQTIKEMTTKDYGVNPVFVDFDSKYTGTQIYGNQEGVGEKILELPIEMTPLQMKTFSAADIPLTIHITKLMDMIEAKEPIEFSSEVKGLLAYMHMLLKKPVNSLIPTVTKMESDTDTSVADDKELLAFHNYAWWEEETGNLYTVFNGEYQVEYEYDFKVETTQAGDVITQYDGVNNTNSNTNTNDSLGILGVSTTVYKYPTELVKSIFTKIELRKNVNAFYSVEGGKRILHLKGKFTTPLRIYNKNKTGSTTSVFHRFSGKKWGTAEYYYLGKNLNFFGFEGDSRKFTLTSKVTPTVTHKHMDFTEYDLLDSSKLLPKISIKDFVINIAKIFNFNISIKDKKLFVDIKRYYMSSEPLLLDDELSVDVSKVNFSRLEIKSGVAQTDLITQYEEAHNTWASKIINTGYSIRKEEEELELPYGTPYALIDYNFFAYDLYGLYLNGGYNRYPVGCTKGFSDELTLGYLGINDETMYVTDAEFINDEFVISNKKLTRQTVNNSVEWVFADGEHEDVTTLDSYSTFLPYRFRDGNIIESLEVNKPHYNFANITDAQYPDSVTLYDRFHKNMLEDKYSANTHVLTDKMFIDGLSDTSKIHNYRNSNYIISELMEYDPTEPNMYEVKLMRVNNVDNYIIPPKQII